MTPSIHATAVADLRDLAMHRLLGLCRDRFPDRVHGGFHEALSDEGAPLPGPRKRLMVQCRQLYVLSHAALLGDRGGQDAAERGYAFLRRAYPDPVHGGWRFAVTPDGAPLDDAKDLYAHAFVLFALAYLHRAFAAPDALSLARETMAVLRDRMAVPAADGGGGGFWDAAAADWTPRRGSRSQNPHMHLLEGVLAQYEASNDAAWLAEADALVGLFGRHFHDPATATLGEHFDDFWTPHPERGHIVEAGHHFEWVWLLHRHAALSRAAAALAAADGLYAVAMRHGFDPGHGGIHDQMGRDGAPILRSRRVWPVAEAIKAQVARIEAGLPVPEDQPMRLIAHLFDDWIAPARAGWIETRDAAGAPSRVTLPGSTPYHLFLAAAETMRVLGP